MISGKAGSSPMMRKTIPLFFAFGPVAALLLVSTVEPGRLAGVKKTADVRKVYRLIQVNPRSEIDGSFLRMIDSVPPPFPAEGPYQIGDIPTIPGRFRVHKFVAVYLGESAQGRREFHDLLVIQTDGCGEIVDGCHYTLEWTDVPSLDLYRFQGKKVILKNDLSTRDLNLINIRTGEVLSEEGIIALKD